MRVFNAPTGFSQTLILIQRRGACGYLTGSVCLRRCGFQRALAGIRTDGVRADAIRVQGRPISGVQRCGEGAFGEMIVECSSSSQAKSELRKEALAGVMWIAQEFFEVLCLRGVVVHSLNHSLPDVQSLGWEEGHSLTFQVGCGHGLPFLCIYRT